MKKNTINIHKIKQTTFKRADFSIGITPENKNALKIKQNTTKPKQNNPINTIAKSYTVYTEPEKWRQDFFIFFINSW